jgi:hypothetical protein
MAAAVTTGWDLVFVTTRGGERKGKREVSVGEAEEGKEELEDAREGNAEVEERSQKGPEADREVTGSEKKAREDPTAVSIGHLLITIRIRSDGQK